MSPHPFLKNFRTTFVLISLTYGQKQEPIIFYYGSYENRELTREYSQLNISIESAVQLVFLHEPNLFTKDSDCNHPIFFASHFRFCCTERVYKRSEHEMKKERRPR